MLTNQFNFIYDFNTKHLCFSTLRDYKTYKFLLKNSTLEYVKIDREKRINDVIHVNIKKIVPKQLNSCLKPDVLIICHKNRTY